MQIERSCVKHGTNYFIGESDFCMYKRFLVFLFLFLFVSGLTACQNTEQFPPVSSESESESVSEPEQSQSEESPLSLYKSVLLNDIPFFSDNRELFISEISRVVSEDSSVKAKATKFALIDLDKDGALEIILWLVVNDNDDFGFEILRRKDDKVLGYTLWYRAFMELKEDGTFSFSGGAADFGYGTIAFTEDGYEVNKISYSESSFDSDNNQTVSYFVNQKKASNEDFLAAIDEQSNKKDVVWYDFSEENIKTHIR
jgi:hypothetical protein